MYRTIESRLPWILLTVISLVSLYYWLLIIDIGSLTAYQLFPILGVIAWQIMWIQFLLQAMKITGFRTISNPTFRRYSRLLVLLLIILHPLILTVQSFIDSGQLPPASYLSYVGTEYAWAIALGIAGLIVFLAYDVLKLFQASLIKHNLNRFVSPFQALAMLAIFIHGLRIGGLMNTDFIYVWIFLGIILAPCLALYVVDDFKPAKI